jgi:hypothetical protein
VSDVKHPAPSTPEHIRLGEDASRAKNWKRWGPYLAERQWGTVREDYSADGEAWQYFPSIRRKAAPTAGRGRPDGCHGPRVPAVFRGGAVEWA